jgi:hypothetical protein
MKHLRRWLFNGVAAVSLVIFLGCIVQVTLHLRSTVYPPFEIRWRFTPSGTLTNSGQKSFTPYRYPPILGFSCGIGVWTSAYSYGKLGIVIIPTWFVLLSTGAIPAAWCSLFLRNREPERRKRLNLCLTCGYDLRATPNQCPECGTVPKLPDNPTKNH